jgi:protein TonB
MRLRIPLLAGLSGLLLASTASLQAQTPGPVPQSDNSEAWKREIVIRLSSKKTFPPGAAGQSATAKVLFVIDRQGKLISRVLVESTGSELLDAAALSMVEQAQPYPVPPAEVGDDQLTFRVPIIFSSKKPRPWAGGEWPAEWVEEQDKVAAKMRGVCRGC